MNMEEFLDKWFEKNPNSALILNQDKYEFLKTVKNMFVVEEPKAIEPKKVRKQKWYPKNRTSREGKTIISNVTMEPKIIKEIRSYGELTNETVEKVLRKNFPHFKEKSITKYIWAYRRHLNLPVKKRTPSIHRHYKKGKNPGKTIKEYGHHMIKENVYNDIKEKCKNQFEKSKAKEILREYYPDVKRSTLKGYVSLYKKYFNDNQKKEINDIKPNYKNQEVLYEEKKEEKPKIPETPEPTGNYAYDEDLKDYILIKEVDAVRQALRQVRYGWKATANNIAIEKDMSVQRVKTVLKILINEKKAEARLLDSGDLVYYLK